MAPQEEQNRLIVSTFIIATAIGAWQISDKIPDNLFGAVITLSLLMFSASASFSILFILGTGYELRYKITRKQLASTKYKVHLLGTYRELYYNASVSIFGPGLAISFVLLVLAFLSNGPSRESVFNFFAVILFIGLVISIMIWPEQFADDGAKSKKREK